MATRGRPKFSSEAKQRSKEAKREHQKQYDRTHKPIRLSFEVYNRLEEIKKLLKAKSWDVTVGLLIDKQETDNLVMDCESVIDDDTESAEESQSNDSSAVRELSKDKVDFSTIHGLPVNLPFSLQYSSSSMDTTVESKVYVIVEPTCVTSVILKQMKPIRINVTWDIQDISLEEKSFKFTQEPKKKNCTSQVTLNSENIIKKTLDLRNFACNNKRVQNPNFVGNNAYYEERVEHTNNVGNNARCENRFINSTLFGDTNKGTLTDDEVDIKAVQIISVGRKKSTNGNMEIISDVKKEIILDDNIETDSVVLNGVIDSELNQCKVIPYDPVEQNNEATKTSSTKRKSIANNPNPKRKQKFFKFEDNPDINLPRSFRIRSKGYRVDYAKLNDFKEDIMSDVSDIDEILSDSDDTSDEVTLNTSHTDENVQPIPSGRRKKGDPDFVPTSFPVNNSELPNDYSSDSNESESGISDFETDESEEIDLETALDKLFKTKKSYYSSRDSQQKKLERLSKLSKRIKVKLSEHTDKYVIEEQVSFERKDRRKKDSEKTAKVLVCKECYKYRTENESQMENHLEYHVNGDLACKKCDYKSFARYDMAKHKTDNHRSKKQIACFQCDEAFPSMEVHRNHITSVHNLLPWMCFLCSSKETPVTFKDRNRRREHYIENHRDKMMCCSDCGQFYSCRTSLNVHHCKEKKDRLTPCDLCGKSIRFWSLKKHKSDVHFNVRPFPCTHCKYAAKQQNELKKHIQAIHEGTHSHKCGLCDFSCVRPFQLTSHMRTHTGQKPYKCDQCPYAAGWNVQLKEHKRLHGGPFGKECEKCGIFLKKGAAFTKHMKKEHDED